MELIVGIICAVLGFLLGILIRLKPNRPVEKMGTLLVDKVDPVANSGVYSFFSVDPQTFEDGQVIEMEVMLITEKNSQEEHG